MILLVDAEQDHLIITRRFLESQGYDCVCADRGWEALRVLQERPVDLILLDLHMPGMDGYCLADVASQARGEAPWPEPIDDHAEV